MCENIKKQAKLLLLLILSISVVGCVNSLKRFDPTTKLEGSNKAVLALYVSAESITIKKFDENYNNLQAKSEEYVMSGGISAIFSEIKDGLNRGSVFENAFYTIEPGIYYISRAYFSSGEYNYYTTLSGLTPEGRVVYGAFEVKPGEVAFLGKLCFNFGKEKADELFTVYADLENAKRKILNSRSKYKSLVPKLQKINFYPSGSRIYLDKDGTYRLSFN
jgi:hypothetical protein